MSEKKPIYVIGHRNPDTDSICTAIAYAALKKNQGEDVMAARAGQINAETQYALNYFGVEAPKHLVDLYPRVKDIMLSCDIVVKPTDTLRRMGQIMQQYALRSVPVTDTAGALVGIVTVSDLAERYFAELNMENLDKAAVTLQSIAEITEGKVLVDAGLSSLVKGKVHIAAGSKCTIEQNLFADAVVLVGEGRYESMLASLQHDIACLIVTNNGDVPENIVEEARNKGTTLIVTAYDTYMAARLINQCVPVGHIMRQSLVSFEQNALLSDIKGTINSTNYRNYPVVEDGKLIGLVSRDNMMEPTPERVILVDHNERGQAIEGIENARILEIIDHHRLGGMQTGDPIYIREEPVGCTATIVANMYWNQEVEIPKAIAGILLSAIISDTVLFKSPTCTKTDVETAERLAKIAGVEIQGYGMEMLKAGSEIGSMSPMEIARNDSKEFQFGDYHVSISQVSVMDDAEVVAQREKILESMESLREQSGLDLVFLMATNILTECTELLYVGAPKTLIGEAFHKNASGDSISLPGVMSRKKQIVPPLSDAVRRMQN